MERLFVNAGGGYEVLIGRGLLDEAGARIAEALPPCRAAVISDTNVLPLYGARLCRSLEAAGFSPECYAFPAGEASKNLQTYAEILDFLAARHFGRGDLIVALGGGVTGDLAGFAAATWLRGVRYVQIPTSLLAAADSSVGGKTAVDLPAGKNLAGAFHQPSLVLCDPATFDTLPEKDWRSGTAEIVKYGLLGSAELFAALEARPLREQTEAVLARCVAIKRDFVEADEFDNGERRKLNLGHSFGHAAERLSNYQIPHGEAVAVGMAMITRAAVRFGLCEEETLPRLLRLLDACGLPAECPYPADAMAEAVLSDKKAADGRISLIVPETVGRCRVRSVPLAELASWLEAGGALSL